MTRTSVSQPLLWTAIVLGIIAVCAWSLIAYNYVREGAATTDEPGGSELVAFKGSANAPVTIVEWSDFQCPYCARFAQQTLPQIEAQYVKTGKARIIYKDYPLSFHPVAQKAAEAGKCALAQGQEKFWALHDKIFANQQQLSVENLKLWAAQSGVNAARFNQCLDNGEMAQVVAQEFSEGQQAGVRGTPGFLVGGQLVSGAQPFEAFKTAIDAALEQ